VNGYKVDFYWPALGLVVETDGLRYHRTSAQQAKDRIRDQAHAAAGLTTLRFTRAQVTFDSDHVMATLSAVAVRLASSWRHASPSGRTVGDSESEKELERSRHEERQRHCR
jgi:very-short-patch-repair endonuclease